MLYIDNHATNSWRDDERINIMSYTLSSTDKFEDLCFKINGLKII